MSIMRQCMVTFLVSITFFYAGYAYGWIPATLVRLVDEGVMTADQASWAVSLTHLGSLLTAVPSGLLSARLGRKPLLISSAPVYILCCVVFYFTMSVPVMLTFRTVQGMAMGVVFSTGPVFIAEMAQPRIRGTLGVVSGSTWSLGMAYQFIVGPFFGYHTLVCTNLFFHIAFLLAFVWIPDTPYSLLLRGKEEAAAASLAWYRGQPREGQEVAEEFEAVKASVTAERGRRASWRDIGRTREGRRGLGLVLLVSVTILLGGGRPIPVFAGKVFESDSGLKHVGAGFINLVCAAGPLAIGFFIDRVGRRPFLVGCAFGAATCCFGTTIYYALDQYSKIDHSRTIWMPYVFLVLASFLQGLMGGVSFPLRAELFESSTRGIASGIVVTTGTIISFLCINLFLFVNSSVGIYLNFLIYTVVGFTGASLIYIYLPETKGKTFDEIQNLLR